jgi:hypothetical protein
MSALYFLPLVPKLPFGNQRAKEVIMNRQKDPMFFIFLRIICIVLFLLNVECVTETKVKPVSFLKSDQLFAPTLTIQIALGDFDGDGDLDAVYANHASNHSKIMMNDGKGHFTDAGQTLTQYGHGVGIGDFDKDGDLDIFITCAGARDERGVFQHRPSQIYFNDGTGDFEDSGQDLGDTELSGNGINLIDIDNDDDLDAHIYYYKESGDPFDHIIYLNDGKGRFSKSDIDFPEGSKLFWGDLNGDQNIDVFLMEWDKGLRAILNDGRARFTPCWLFPDTTLKYGDAALADFDSDGDLDALVANRGGSPNDSTRIFFNDGSGHFFESKYKFSPVKLPEIYLSDLNNDGSTDVYFDLYRRDNIIWLNDGKGRFVDSGIHMDEGNVAIGDLDGDGDMDIIGTNSVWFNTNKNE